MKQHHFTHIDLIVVMLCAAAAMTIGSLCLNAAVAKRISCADRLARISQSVFAYADAYGEYTVPSSSGKECGWMRVLSTFDKTLRPMHFQCPDDTVKRNFDGAPISYALNLGHIWNVQQTPTNISEWGPASAINRASLMLGRIPEPSDTVWFFEYHYAGNNFNQLGRHGDRTLFTTYTLEAFHSKETQNNILFIDGHIEAVEKKTWKVGDNRGIVYKDIHKICVPNRR